MKKNMGSIDRIVRFVVAAVVAGLYIAGVVDGVLAYVLLGFSSVFVLTSLLGFCPLYMAFGLRTCPAEPKRG